MTQNNFEDGAVLLPYEFDVATMLYSDLRGVIDHHDRNKLQCSAYLRALYDLRSGVVLHVAWTISKVMRHYCAAIGLPEEDYEALRLLQASLGGLNAVNDAIRYLDSALVENPQLGEALYHKGLILAALGDHDKAILAFQAASGFLPAIIPSNQDIVFKSRVLFDCGKSFEECERYTEAGDCYEHAIELQPDFPDAQKRYAICLQRMGKWAAAAVHFDRAMTYRPILPTLPKLPARIAPASDQKVVHPPQFRSDLNNGPRRVSLLVKAPIGQGYQARRLAQRALSVLRRRTPVGVKRLLRPIYISLFGPGARQLAERTLSILRRRTPVRIKRLLRPIYISLFRRHG